jgi:hypothetical protein
MKKQTQIGKNGSRRAAVSQVKSPSSEPALPRLRPPRKAKRSGDIVTCLWLRSDGQLYAQVDFPRRLFMRIQRAASADGLTLAEFFDNAIKEACKKGGLFEALENRAA